MATFNGNRKRTAYKRLPPEVQNLVMDNETTELISNELKKVGLNDEQVNLADSEILYAMYCLQSLDEAISNISKLSGKSVEDLSGLKNKIQEEILSKYKIDINDFIELNKKEIIQTPTPEAQSEGKSSKPQVPEIAPDLHPMIEKGEVAHSVPHQENHKSQAPNPKQIQHVETPNSKPQITNNTQQPIINNKPTELPKDKMPKPPKSSYPTGQDPYRESVE